MSWVVLALAVACRNDTKGGTETGLVDPADGGAATDDADGDGYAAAEAGGDDCDDADAAVNPGAEEACNGIDDDCDGDVDEDAVDAPTWYADADGDGYGDAATSVASCDAPSGWVADDQDCDDADATLNPDTVWYADADGDGWPASSPSVTACEAPSGFVAATGDWDCDDGDPGVYPGATEACDGADDDCDGTADDGVLGTGAACPAESCAAVLADDPSAADGDYYLDPTGTGDVGTWTCDMTTDGGGWTLIADWDAENDGDTIADFEATFSEDFNDMTDWTDPGGYIRWSDYDDGADVMAYSVGVDVPNDGEVLLDVHLSGTSYEDSATFFSGVVGGAEEEVLCAVYEDTSIATSGILSAWSATEQAYWPSYTCSSWVATPAGVDFYWDDTWQVTLSGAVESLEITSFHYDNNYGDTTRLYRLAWWVR